MCVFRDPKGVRLVKVSSYVSSVYSERNYSLGGFYDFNRTVTSRRFLKEASSNIIRSLARMTSIRTTTNYSVLGKGVVLRVLFGGERHLLSVGVASASVLFRTSDFDETRGMVRGGPNVSSGVGK